MPLFSIAPAFRSRLVTGILNISIFLISPCILPFRLMWISQSPDSEHTYWEYSMRLFLSPELFLVILVVLARLLTIVPSMPSYLLFLICHRRSAPATIYLQPQSVCGYNLSPAAVSLRPQSVSSRSLSPAAMMRSVLSHSSAHKRILSWRNFLQPTTSCCHHILHKPSLPVSL
jgi:hypothetical protein